MCVVLLERTLSLGHHHFIASSNEACFLSKRDIVSLKAVCCKHNPEKWPGKKQSEPCIPSILVRRAKAWETKGGLSPITQYLPTFKPHFQSYFPPMHPPTASVHSNFFLLWTHDFTSQTHCSTWSDTCLYHIKILCFLFPEWFYDFWRLKKNYLVNATKQQQNW